MSLKGKYALITGSSRGIGRGIALKLAEGGANIAVHYFQNEAAAKQTRSRSVGAVHELWLSGGVPSRVHTDTSTPRFALRSV